MAAMMDVPAMRGRKAGVRRMKKHSLKTDMTPMVDLGFLLIAFFVITAELSEPRSSPLNMSHDGPEMPVGISNALTVLIGDNSTIYYYQGEWNEAKRTGSISKGTFAGTNSLRTTIIEKQRILDRNLAGEGRKGLMLIIKPGEYANYEDIVNALDEALINEVEKYTLVSLSAEESAWLEEHSN